MSPRANTHSRFLFFLSCCKCFTCMQLRMMFHRFTCSSRVQSKPTKTTLQGSIPESRLFGSHTTDLHQSPHTPSPKTRRSTTHTHPHVSEMRRSTTPPSLDPSRMTCMRVQSKNGQHLQHKQRPQPQLGLASSTSTAQAQDNCCHKLSQPWLLIPRACGHGFLS